MRAGLLTIREIDINYLEIPIVFERDHIDTGELYQHEDKIYRVWMINKSQDFAALQQINIKDEPNEEEYGEDNIKCPVCGYEEPDSWEYAEESEESECGKCGAILSYNKNVSVTYNTQLVRKPEIIIL
jgi:hypothetical protein